MKIITMVKGAIGAMTAVGLLAILAGCPQKEGPGERAGKAIDSAVGKAGQKIEKFGEDVRDTAKDAKK